MDTIQWLLEGDVSIQYQTRKYLLGESEAKLKPLRRRIAREGWGERFLQARNENGHWSREFYQIKWQSSHYTLLDLRYLEIEPVDPIRKTLEIILRDHQGVDGSIYESREMRSGDVCVNGMFLNYASFFGGGKAQLERVVDFLLGTALPDGGYNCRYLQKHTHHSSMHTTIAVLEGFCGFLKMGSAYRREEILAAQAAGESFLLSHRLYQSDHTGQVIDPHWLMLSFPSRWKYDILRAMLYFVDAGRPFDPRMTDAISVLMSKRRTDGAWPVQARHAGEVHFDMEKTGAASRCNTLRALRVLQAYASDIRTYSGDSCQKDE